MNIFAPSPVDAAGDIHIMQSLGTIYLETQIPDALREVVDRHHQHLAALIKSLRSAGISEPLVKQSIDVLIESYRAELSAVAFRLVKDPQGV